MADDDFATNLMKLACAQLQITLDLQMAQDMFGKSYHSLGNMEKIAVDHAVQGMVVAMYHNLTPEYLRTQPQTQQPVGFQGPGGVSKQES